jgi:ADP-heptose:LPS heptosyltransferase
MSPLKRLEGWAKKALAVLMTALLFRPGRRARALALLKAPKRVLLVRPDARVGEALLMTPLLSSLQSLYPAPRVDVLLHKKVARVLRGHPEVDHVRPFDRRWLILGPWAPGISTLRSQRYDVVVDCGNWEVPSVTSALIARLAGPQAAVVGPAPWPVGPLHDVAIAPRTDTKNEVLQRLHLLSALPDVGLRPELSLHPGPPGERVAKLRQSLEGRRWAVVNPGGRLGWRCAPPALFTSAIRELDRRGILPVITWGPGEESLAHFAQGDVSNALVAPPTSLDELAALMRGAALTVCNNTGPMHLSVAMQTPTLALFLHMDVERWGHGQPPHRMLDLTAHADSFQGMEQQVISAIGELARPRGPAAAEASTAT